MLCKRQVPYFPFACWGPCPLDLDLLFVMQVTVSCFDYLAFDCDVYLLQSHDFDVDC